MLAIILFTLLGTTCLFPASAAVEANKQVSSNIGRYSYKLLISGTPVVASYV